MIKKIMFCVLTIVVITAKAQFPSPYTVPNTDWIKYFSGMDLVVSAPTTLDANSNVFIAGYIGTTTASDLIVLKYDSTGVTSYTYMYNNGGYDIAKAIKIDGSGNAVIVGISDGGGTGLDYIMIKLGPTGSVIWTKRWDAGIGGLTDEAIDLAILANGDVIVTGRSQNANGDFDIVTLRLDGNNGNTMWGSPHSFNGAGNMDESATGIVLSSDGQIAYITGSTTDPSNGTDIVTYALDANAGGFTWSPVITNGSGNANDRSNGIILCGGNISICGEIDNGVGATSMDGVLIKYDGSNGTILFKTEYDAYSGADRATALARDSAGNIGVISTAANGSYYEYHTNLYDSTGTQYALNKETTGLGILSVDPKICNDTIAHHWYVSGEALRATKDIFVYQMSPSATTSWKHYVDGQNNDIDCATGIAVNGVGVVYIGALSKNSMADYDLTTIKLNQTPVYWPPDFTGETVNNGHLYLKNQGQLLRNDTTLANEVLYYTHNANPEVYIEQNAFDFVFNHTDTVQSTLDSLEKIQFKFLSCNTLANAHEYLPKLTNYNYYLGYAVSPAIENVQGNERIFVPNFYPYVDLHYFSGANGIKYYLVAKPGALAGEIRIQINGANSTGILASGELGMTGVFGNILLEKPIAYTVNWLGAVVTITTGSASWNSLGSNMYSINLPSYNNTWPLIIEVASAQTATVPAVSHADLDYSTYYGGSGEEAFNDIKAAANGDRHITGWTNSQYFPVQNSISLFKGNKDVVVLKYTADDTIRVASFMGGINDDIGNSIDVNSNNEVFIGGSTVSTDFPAKPLFGASNQTVNGLVPTSGYYQDGFLAKFSPTLNASGRPSLSHTWSRFLGGPGDDQINSIFVDGPGNLYFVGEAKSQTITSLSGTNSSTNGSSDAILGKFTPTLSIVFGGFLGGYNSPFTNNSRDIGMDITVDNSGGVIVCGRTDVANFGVMNSTGNSNVFSQGLKGSFDGFLVRYSSTGTKQYSTYFGGNGLDAITRLAHNPITDDIFFAGDSYDTTSFPFLAKSGAFNSRHKIARAAFVGQIGGDLTKKWCSYYGRGTSGTYTVAGLSVDSRGLLYVSGMTTSDTIQRPLTSPLTTVYQDSVKNNTEGFVAIFKPNQDLYHAHYFGGGNVDEIYGADISQDKKLYVVGYTLSNNFPIAYSSVNASQIDSTYNGGSDGFISRFDLTNYQITGIKESTFDKAHLSVYPNPANTGFNLELQSELTSHVNLKAFNLMGQLIYEQDVKDKKTSINCESWPNGVYLISVSNAQSQSTFKLIKN